MEFSSEQPFYFKSPGRQSRAETVAVTPTSRRGKWNRTTTPDRFIPSRAVNNLSASQHLLATSGRQRGREPLRRGLPSSSNDQSLCLSPAERESHCAYREGLSAVFGDISNRVLTFGVKPLQSADDLLFESPGSFAGIKKTPHSCRKRKLRSVPMTADRVLDAPDAVDDFYINPLHWGGSNTLAVGLGAAVYIWNADTGSINELHRLPFPSSYVTSLQWDARGRYLAIGTSDAEVQVWNAEKCKKVLSSNSHATRVSALSWNQGMLSSGSRSGEIHHYDVRQRDMLVGSSQGHSQEVCGLQWSPNGHYLASGGNDCLVNVWDARGRDPWKQPKCALTEHKAAVKALAWCPWQSNLLATGGGTADKTIRFWNATSGLCVESITANSQVSGLVWNEEHREIAVAHGYPSNQLTLYQYPSLRTVAELKGHEGRILHLTASPSGTTVATVGADETLRLWKCFESPDHEPQATPCKRRLLDTTSLVSPFTLLR